MLQRRTEQERAQAQNPGPAAVAEPAPAHAPSAGHAPRSRIKDEDRQQIIDLLIVSYGMELETVCNYLANSIHLDGIRAKEIKDSLAAEVPAELEHARKVAQRIHTLHGRVPGSQELRMAQQTLQPPANSFDIRTIIQGVIDAEVAAIDQYQRIIEFTAEVDMVTQELCIQLKGDEEEHLRLFEGYLAEAESMPV